MQRVAIYPGSFDPFTNGHLDILERGLTLFDRVIIAVLLNSSKQALFSVEERIQMIQASVAQFTNVEVDSFAGLTVEFAKKCKAQAILRGMRAVSDFEYEFQLALMNRRLERDVQTVFLMTGLRWIFTSSSIIKEAARFGGDIRDMVPDVVHRALAAKFNLASAQK